jgi:hypothetical protein
MNPAITALDDETRAEIDETIEMLTGNLEKIAEHGRRADNIVKSMLGHSRGSSGKRRIVSATRREWLSFVGKTCSAQTEVKGLLAKRPMLWISNPGSDRAVTCQRVNFRLEPDGVGKRRPCFI